MRFYAASCFPRLFPMAEPQRLGPGFDPVAGADSRILILGSFPSAKSREQGFYYGHPRNRFWPLLADILGCPMPETIREKQSLVLRNGLALWDTVRCCVITGASDASIRDVEPNNIAALCKKYPIQKIFCNGAVSWRVYEKYARASTGISAGRLPSTSPANAAWSMRRLKKEWSSQLFGNTEFRPTEEQL